MEVFRNIFIGAAVLAGLVFLVTLGWALRPGPKVPLSYNLRNLRVRWKTALVTSLAFTLVVFMLVFMMSFVRSMFRMTAESGVPGNVMILSDGATDEAFSNLPKAARVEDLPHDVQQQIVKDETGRYLAVKEVYVVVNHQLAETAGGRKTRFVQMRGVDDPLLAAKVHNIELQPGGRWFTGSAVREVVHKGKTTTAKEVVVGDGVARVFGRDFNKDYVEVGDILEIGPLLWVVVGIMQPSGSSFGNEVWGKDSYIGDTYGRQGTYSTYVARTRDEETAKLAAQVVKKFRRDTSFNALTEKEYYAGLSQTSTQFLIAFTVIAVIMGIGGVLGVVVTMFAAISQRTKDIGVLRLLGYTRWQIFVSFLLESLVIALVGGLLGCAIAYVFANGLTVTSIITAGAGGGGKSVVLKLMVDPLVLGGAMVFTLIMGAAGGLAPSLSAMRLKPLESLR